MLVVEVRALERRPYEEMRAMLVGRARGYSVLEVDLSIRIPPDADVPTLLKEVPISSPEVEPEVLLPVPPDADVTALPHEVPSWDTGAGAEVGPEVLLGTRSLPFVLN